MKLTISTDTYHDLILMGSSQITRELLAVARDVVRQGGQVIIQHEFVNAPPHARSCAQKGQAKYR